jgi:hypothetical protein
VDGHFEVIYEATISTIENAAQAAARVLESKFEQERTRDLAQPPASGA